jgi:predicted Zn finger-like uncharacterized protein
MIVTCEECGKKYEIDPAQIKGTEASFRCKACNSLITVAKPQDNSGAPPSPPLAEEEKKKKGRADNVRKSRGLGIRGRMFLVLFLIPIVMLVIAVPFAVRYINKTTNLIVQESLQTELEGAKDEINQIANIIANQVEFYLLSHPELEREGVQTDPALRDIVTQQLLMSGEAILYLRIGSEDAGTILIHSNPALQGKPFQSLMVKGELDGNRYDEFGKIVMVGPAGEEHRKASDFYLSKDESGILKERIFTFAPVSKTPYGIIYSAQTEDFMLPVKTLEERIAGLILETRNIVVAVFGGTLIIIGIIMLLYVQRITSRIKTLTDVTNRISVGELEAHVEAKSKDEIGELAEAISRMQESIRLAIERLRRRR